MLRWEGNYLIKGACSLLSEWCNHRISCLCSSSKRAQLRKTRSGGKIGFSRSQKWRWSGGKKNRLFEKTNSREMQKVKNEETAVKIINNLSRSQNNLGIFRNVWAVKFVLIFSPNSLSLSLDLALTYLEDKNEVINNPMLVAANCV